MAQYDGSIRINTKIEVVQAEKELKKLEGSIEKTAGKISSLRSKMDALKDVQIPTQEYTEIQKQIEATEKKINDLMARQEKFLATGGKESSSTYQRMQYNLDSLRNSLPFLKGELQDLVDSGKAFSLGSDTKEYSEMSKQVQKLNQQMESDTERQSELQSAIAEREQRLSELKENAIVSDQKIVELAERRKQLLQEIKDLEEVGVTQGYADYDSRKQEITEIEQSLKDYSNNVQNTKNSYKTLSESIKNAFRLLKRSFKDIPIAAAKKGVEGLNAAFRGLGSIGKKSLSFVGSGLKKMTSSMLGFGKSTKKSNDILQSSFKNILKYGLGIRSLYVLVNKIRSGIKEGFSNLANENESFKNSVNSLKASLLTLKNAFAGAFAPIVQIAIPYIQQFIGWITSAIDAVGQFIAALTGKKTYTKAIKQTASAFEDEAKAAKKAKEETEGYLSPLDEINKYSDGKNKGASAGDGAGAIGAGQMFEEVSIASKFEELAKKVKDIFSQIFAPIKEAWNREGKFVMDSWKYALGEIWNLAKGIGRDFLKVWNQEATISMLSDMLHIIGDIGLVVGNLADRFREAWNTNDIGLRILENIRDIFAIIIGHIRSAADYTIEWSKKLDFYPLLESINGLLESLKPLTDNIGAGLEWFYKNVLLPITGWAIQEAIPAFLDMLTAAIYAVNQVIEVLKPLGTWLWENFLQPLGKWAGETIIKAMTKVTDLLTKLGDWISKHSEAIQKFITIVAPIVGVVTLIAKAGTILGNVIEWLAPIIALLTNPITWVVAGLAALAAGFVYLYEHSERFRDFIDGIIEGAKQLIPGIIEGIKSGWDSFIGWLGDLWDEIVKSFKDFFGIHSPSKLMEEMGEYLMEGLFNGISSLIGKVVSIFSDIKDKITTKWNEIKQKTTEIWNGIKAKITEIWSSIKTSVSNSINAVKTTVSTIWNGIKTTTSTIWNGIKSALSSAWSGIKNIASNSFDNIKNAIVGVWDSLKTTTSRIWQGIVNVVKSPINAIIGLLNGLLRGMASAVNGIARMFNSLRIDIPSWVPGIGGGRLGFNIPTWTPGSIPYLAKGTVIPPNKEFLAVLGDQKHGTNVEAPLDTIKQANRESLLEVLSELGLMGGGTSKGNTYNIKAEANRKVLFELMIEEGKMRQMSSGRNPFLLNLT